MLRGQGFEAHRGRLTFLASQSQKDSVSHLRVALACVVSLSCACGARRALTPRPPPVSTLLSFSKPTLIEYGAKWCPPCLTLSPLLDAYAVKNQHVKVVKVDLSQMSETEVEQLLSGADAFPVIRIFDSTGHFQTQLTGAECFDFEAAIHKHLTR
jgi:thiol-disulfide isomerase/thioredoxin